MARDVRSDCTVRFFCPKRILAKSERPRSLQGNVGYTRGKYRAVTICNPCNAGANLHRSECLFLFRCHIGIQSLTGNLTIALDGQGCSIVTYDILNLPVFPCCQRRQRNRSSQKAEHQCHCQPSFSLQSYFLLLSEWGFLSVCFICSFPLSKGTPFESPLFSLQMPQFFVNSSINAEKNLALFIY